LAGMTRENQGRVLGSLGKGLYLLLLELDHVIDPVIAGQRLALGPGLYVYVGSACGPGGLRARLARHLCGRRRRLHWHIDKLIVAGLSPRLAIAIPGEKLCRHRAEPYLALALGATSAFKPVGRGVGSSDDKIAPTHLYRCMGPRCWEALLAASLALPGLPVVLEPGGFCNGF